MPEKGSRTWHTRMLEHESVAGWYNNLARRNPTTADVYLRRIARVVDGAMGKSPVDLVAMEQQDLEDAVSACIDYEFQRGMLGSTVTGFNKAIKSFLKWHGRKITRDNTIPEANEHPNAESEQVPDQDSLRAVLKAAEPRTAAMVCVVAQGGQRLQVLGLIDASLGLRLGDFVEARVTPAGLEFLEMPTRVEVPRKLSKNGKPYFFFLGPEACEHIQAYLRHRVKLGEELTPESPLFRPEGGEPRFMLRNNIGDNIRRAMRTAGVAGRPYVWRSYYANRCQLAESKGFLEAWRKFFMGHTGNIQTRYATRKGALPKDSIEQMRQAYGKALPFLESHVPTRTSAKAEMVEMMLRASGYTQEQVQELDLTGKTEEELAQLMQAVLEGRPAGQSDPKPVAAARQRVIALTELEGALAEGWMFKASLPGEKAVVELA